MMYLPKRDVPLIETLKNIKNINFSKNEKNLRVFQRDNKKKKYNVVIVK